jgi:protocatechuate 3,4-dioxygenase beta subunit
MLAGGIGSVAFAAYGSPSKDTASTTATAASGDSSSAASSADVTTAVPEETGGPFPADGSNGPNVLTESGVVRSDITKSFGDSSGTAEGVPTTIEMTLIDVAGGGKPLAGAAVYLWHCDRSGAYSLYDPSVSGENFLRGVQKSDSKGKAAFQSIFPAAYSGRWPHIHFEIYESLDAATAAGTKLRTSQIALPQKTCEAVYKTAGYEQSVQNLAQTSLETDNVFSDGYAGQLATGSGSPDDGITVKLNVGV